MYFSANHSYVRLLHSMKEKYGLIFSKFVTVFCAKSGSCCAVLNYLKALTTWFHLTIQVTLRPQKAIQIAEKSFLCFYLLEFNTELFFLLPSVWATGMVKSASVPDTLT